MSDDWKPGDRALCVNDAPHEWKRSNGGLKRGSIYTVDSVVPGTGADTGSLGLTLVELAITRADSEAFRASRFRKIHPLTDQEREEALRELNTPVREIVA